MKIIFHMKPVFNERQKNFKLPNGDGGIIKMAAMNYAKTYFYVNDDPGATLTFFEFDSFGL